MGAYLTLHKYDNKFNDIYQIKNEGSPNLAQNEVQADIFFRFFGSFSIRKGRFAGGRKGGLGGIPPALQILGEICSNFFERTPPVGKCLCWLALSHFALRATRDKYAGSPADFKRKLEFFIFAPLLRGWPKAGFPNFHF